MLGRISPQPLPGIVVTAALLLSLLASTLCLSAAKTTHVSGHVTPSVGTDPHYAYVGHATAGPPFACQTSTTNRCYIPQQIRDAYDIQPLLNTGITGQGRTIVIVDAYQNPTMNSDLHLFDTTFGINDPTLNIIAPDGLTPFDPTDSTQVGWSGEIALDVEWAHAVAPDAIIDLVLAKSSQDADILSATSYAINHNLGDVISQSFGEGETCVDPQILQQEHHEFFFAALKGITLLASSGDQGAAQPSCDGTSYFLSASSPASDPFVTAVGGTQLIADPSTGAYGSETSWEEPGDNGGSGGGFSTIYNKPFYQLGIPAIGAHRGVPDVSYNAAVNGGVMTVWGSSGLGQGLIFRFGGTSAASPQWAGITALGAQLGHRRLGFLNLAIYLIGHLGLYSQTFHDVTSGNNTFVGQDPNGNSLTINGYNTSTGWDPVTGWGSPRVSSLLPALLHLALPTPNQISQLAN
ncbi:MAG: S53 family peptidase [Chloroflexi bacterium]|nr:S53 family peptidase [Chloroflexota bacterium]